MRGVKILRNRSTSDNLSLIQICESWVKTEGTINTLEQILNWIDKKNKEIHVSIERLSLSEMRDWYYDENCGRIVNHTHSFFDISGIKRYSSEKTINEQPIIVQSEIGYLGIIGKVIDGVMYFLMQAKIEPGNINKIQISPTIQATKSNFMCVHGGKSPKYIEYFSQKGKYEIIVDQIQSEQSSRFYGKRNRNMMIIIDDDIKVEDSHMWMTLGQVKQLMEFDNLVNMDTRSVISCIPLALRDFTNKELKYLGTLFSSEALFNSLFLGKAGMEINMIYQYMNEIKMLDEYRVELIDLHMLKNWYYNDNAYVSSNSDFNIIFCSIEIEGREVSKWQQPLFEAKTVLILGLIYSIFDGKINFLVHSISEIGCFDKIELGPTIQCTLNEDIHRDDVQVLFFSKYKKNEGIVFSGLFSEEGGRFYHEENRNVLMQIDKNEICVLPPGYFWADYQTLNILIQFNNCLNIQLRNLISILKL